MRQVGLDYAHKIQPFLSKAHFQEIADALNGAEEAENCSVVVPSLYGDSHKKRKHHIQPQESTTVYVDAVKGQDSNDGSVTSPLKTIAKAIQVTRQTIITAPQLL